MALEALQESKPIDIDDPTAFYRSAHAIEALRAALAQPEQEPVAWCIVENGRVHGLVKSKPAVMNAEKWQPLYTAPPQREWQGLTDEEIKSVQRDAGVTYFVPADYDRHLFTHITDEKLMKIARAIEAKLKEKNS